MQWFKIRMFCFSASADCILLDAAAAAFSDDVGMLAEGLAVSDAVLIFDITHENTPFVFCILGKRGFFYSPFGEICSVYFIF